MSSQSSVAVLGLGRMGAALARALLRQNRAVTVWNRSPERAEPLLASGARTSASVAEAVADSSLILICVLDHLASRELIESENVIPMLAGKTIVDLTSSTAEQIAAQQEFACKHGAHFISGGILSFPAGIGETDAVMLYAGDGPAFEKHRSTLACLGGSSRYLGADPRATFHVMATLGVFVEGTAALFLETSAVARQYGIAMETYFSLAALAKDMLYRQLRPCADRVVGRRLGGEEASIDLHLHFVEEMLPSIVKTGIPVMMTQAYVAVMRLASERGFGDSDLAAIAEVLWAERNR